MKIILSRAEASEALVKYIKECYAVDVSVDDVDFSGFRSPTGLQVAIDVKLPNIDYSKDGDDVEQEEHNTNPQPVHEKPTRPAKSKKSEPEKKLSAIDMLSPEDKALASNILIICNGAENNKRGLILAQLKKGTDALSAWAKQHEIVWGFMTEDPFEEDDTEQEEYEEPEPEGQDEQEEGQGEESPESEQGISIEDLPDADRELAEDILQICGSGASNKKLMIHGKLNDGSPLLEDWASNNPDAQAILNGSDESHTETKPASPKTSIFERIKRQQTAQNE